MWPTLGFGAAENDCTSIEYLNEYAADTIENFEKCWCSGLDYKLPSSALRRAGGPLVSWCVTPGCATKATLSQHSKVLTNKKHTSINLRQIHSLSIKSD